MFRNKKDRVDGELKVVMLGESGVGKSSILRRYIDDTFIEFVESTIGAAFMNKKIIYQNKIYNLDIWDTAGQERYKSLMPMYYRNAKGAVIVYSVNNKDSFETAKKWLRILLDFHKDNVIIYLVENKKDLNIKVDNRNEIEQIIKNDNVFFIETSAKDSYNIEKLFVKLSESMVNHSYILNNGKHNLFIDSEITKNENCCY